MHQPPAGDAGSSPGGSGPQSVETPWGPEAFRAERQAHLAQEAALRHAAQQREFKKRARRRWRRVGLLLFTLFVVLPAGLRIGSLMVQPGSIDHAASNTLRADERPTAGKGAREQPLGKPAPTKESSNFRYLWTQPGGAPVAWDPCRPIRYVVNDRTAPRAGERLLSEALQEIGDATGLRFVHETDVDERPRLQRQGYDPDEYGDRWAPVLIAWSDPAEYALLRGSVLGVAGPVTTVRSSDPTQQVYVSGSLTLDGPQVHQQMEDHADGEEMVKAVIVHELGHLVGLDHIEDEMQLMNSYVVHGVHELGQGDRAGLHQLGLGQCAPDV